MSEEERLMGEETSGPGEGRDAVRAGAAGGGPTESGPPPTGAHTGELVDGVPLCITHGYQPIATVEWGPFTLGLPDNWRSITAECGAVVRPRGVARLTRAEHVSGVRVGPPGPSTPLRSPEPAVAARICRVCGCTDDDCSTCVAASGSPCSWVAADLCSRCAPGVSDPGTPGVRHAARKAVAAGVAGVGPRMREALAELAYVLEITEASGEYPDGEHTDHPEASRAIRTLVSLFHPRAAGLAELRRREPGELITLSDAVQAVAMDVEPNTLGAPDGPEAAEWEEFELTARSPAGNRLKNGPTRTLDGVARRAADLEASGWDVVVVSRRRVRTTRWESDTEPVSAARLAAARSDGGGRDGR